MANRNGIPCHLETLPSGRLRWHVSVAGQRHKETLPEGMSTTDAEDHAFERYATLRRQARSRRGMPATLVRMSDLLERFRTDRLPELPAESTRRAYGLSLDRFAEFFISECRDPRVSDVARAHVKEFIAWRRVNRRGRGKKPVSARTLNKDKTVLHNVFEFAAELDWRADNPCSRVKAIKHDKRPPVILQPDEYERLLAACAEQPLLHLFVLALGESGARSESEVLHLQWDDVDLARQRVTFVTGRNGHRTKGGRSRVCPMSVRLATAMRAHFAAYRLASYGGQPTPWVFHHYRHRRRARPGQRVTSLRRSFRTAAEKAGLERLVQHDLRHSRITWWIAQGANVVHVKEAVGHADLRTTMGYTHLAEEHVDALLALDGVEQPWNGRPQEGAETRGILRNGQTVSHKGTEETRTA